MLKGITNLESIQTENLFSSYSSVGYGGFGIKPNPSNLMGQSEISSEIFVFLRV